MVTIKMIAKECGFSIATVSTVSYTHLTLPTKWSV